MKLTINTPLFTKDGRQIGNAIIIAEPKSGTFFTIKTDYGNEVRLSKYEIESLFHTESNKTDLELKFIRDNHKNSI